MPTVQRSNFIFRTIEGIQFDFTIRQCPGDKRSDNDGNVTGAFITQSGEMDTVQIQAASSLLHLVSKSHNYFLILILRQASLFGFTTNLIAFLTINFNPKLHTS